MFNGCYLHQNADKSVEYKGKSRFGYDCYIKKRPPTCEDEFEIKILEPNFIWMIDNETPSLYLKTLYEIIPAIYKDCISKISILDKDLNVFDGKELILNDMMLDLDVDHFNIEIKLTVFIKLQTDFGKSKLQKVTIVDQIWT